MKTYNKIIFVSQSDTCRSVIAEAIMEKLKNNPRTIVESRGLVVLFPEPPNPKAVEAARKNGIIINHQARELAVEDFSDDTLVLAMTEHQKKNIYETFISAVNTYTIREFVDEIGDIEAPYGKGLPEYEETFTMIKRLIEKVILKGVLQ